jgi:hypothetical protein
VPARAGKKQAVDTPSSDAVGRELDALADEADAFVRAQRTLGGKGKGKAARWADSEDDDEDLWLIGSPVAVAAGGRFSSALRVRGGAVSPLCPALPACDRGCAL